MGYKLNEEGWTIIEPIAQKLACLQAGQSLHINDEPEAIKRLRYVIYAWLYETGQKPNFRIIQPAPSALQVLKRAVMKPQLTVEDKVQDFVECNLIEVDDESEAARRIREAVQSKSIDAEQAVRAMQEWSRIQGK